MDRLDISSDLTVYQLVQQFGSRNQEKMQPLGEFKLEFSEPTLTVHSLHTGSALHRELQAGVELNWTPGNNLFRLGMQGQFIPVLETSEDVKMTVLVVTVRALRELIGEEASQNLLANLGVLDTPTIKAAPIPKLVTEPLRQCLASGCSGPLHHLYAQSRVLEYVWMLATYAGGDRRPRVFCNRSADTIHALHDYLLNLEGAMPTLPELAKRFGESAQSLNRHFVREYGQTIYAMVSNHRLSLAHKALAESGTSIKAIAARLGYSHVNHFTHAFKMKFGYTPGSLRRTGEAAYCSGPVKFKQRIEPDGPGSSS
jgi:AraC-like DNA-binding protein